MADMLVKLYTLPEITPVLDDLKKIGIEIRRAVPSDKHTIVNWVHQHFQEMWANECEITLEQRPVTCYLAVEKQPAQPNADPYALPPEVIVGFACYDAVRKGMFGPEGVRDDYRGRGIGRGLLLACLHSMRAERYAYAVIGWAGPVDFYKRTVGATVIDDSEPGVFSGPLTS